MSDDSTSTCAPAPFDHAKADIILRSSDNTDFRIFRLFLSLASPVFEALFDIPQPTQASEDQEIKDGLPVIPVAEDSKTLDALLRFCYPCTLTDDPNIETLKVALDVLEAARKYSLDAIEKKARQAISNPKILDAEPLRCFAVAHQGRLQEETLLAAKYTLTQPLIPSWFQEIELITASNLLSLLTYHRKCGDAVYALRNDLSWITSHYGSSEASSWLSGKAQYITHYGSVDYRNCQCPGTSPSKYTVFSDTHRSLLWWENYVEDVFTELREKPCKATVQACAENAIHVVRALDCQACSPRITEGMRDFSELLVRKVDETVAQINLELDF